MKLTLEIRQPKSDQINPIEAEPIYESEEGKTVLVAATTKQLFLKSLKEFDQGDPNLLQILCSTHSLFTDSITLFNQFIEHNHLICLQFWIENFYQQFEEKETLREHLLSTLKNLKTKQLNSFDVQCFTHKIQTFLKNQQKDWTEKKNEKLYPTPHLPQLPNVPSPVVTSLQGMHPVEVARQLSLVEFGIFKKIGCFELINRIRDRNAHAPNLVDMIQRTNNIIYGIATEILQGETVKQRAATISRCIEIAQHCRSYSNFNSVMELVGALNCNPISRLKRTWSAVNESLMQQLEELEEEMKPRAGYVQYRQQLQRVLQEKEAVVPFLGVILTDLTLANENVDLVKDSLLNVRKLALFSKVLAEMKSFQAREYLFHPVDSIQQYFLHLPVWQEEDLYERSIKLEPSTSDSKKREFGRKKSELSTIPESPPPATKRKNTLEEDEIVYIMPSIINQRGKKDREKNSLLSATPTKSAPFGPSPTSLSYNNRGRSSDEHLVHNPLHHYSNFTLSLSSSSVPFNNNALLSSSTTGSSLPTSSSYSNCWAGLGPSGTSNSVPGSSTWKSSPHAKTAVIPKDLIADATNSPPARSKGWGSTLPSRKTLVDLFSRQAQEHSDSHTVVNPLCNCGVGGGGGGSTISLPSLKKSSSASKQNFSQSISKLHLPVISPSDSHNQYPLKHRHKDKEICHCSVSKLGKSISLERTSPHPTIIFSPRRPRSEELGRGMDDYLFLTPQSNDADELREAILALEQLETQKEDKEDKEEDKDKDKDKEDEEKDEEKDKEKGKDEEKDSEKSKEKEKDINSLSPSSSTASSPSPSSSLRTGGRVSPLIDSFGNLDEDDDIGFRRVSRVSSPDLLSPEENGLLSSLYPSSSSFLNTSKTSIASTSPGEATSSPVQIRSTTPSSMPSSPQTSCSPPSSSMWSLGTWGSNSSSIWRSSSSISSTSSTSPLGNGTSTSKFPSQPRNSTKFPLSSTFDELRNRFRSDRPNHRDSIKPTPTPDDEAHPPPSSSSSSSSSPSSSSPPSSNLPPKIMTRLLKDRWKTSSWNNKNESSTPNHTTSSSPNQILPQTQSKSFSAPETNPPFPKRKNSYPRQFPLRKKTS